MYEKTGFWSHYEMLTIQDIILVCSSGLQNAAEYAFPTQPVFVNLVPRILPSFWCLGHYLLSNNF